VLPTAAVETRSRGVGMAGWFTTGGAATRNVPLRTLEMAFPLSSTLIWKA